MTKNSHPEDVKSSPMIVLVSPQIINLGQGDITIVVCVNQQPISSEKKVDKESLMKRLFKGIASVAKWIWLAIVPSV